MTANVCSTSKRSTFALVRLLPPTLILGAAPVATNGSARHDSAPRRHVLQTHFLGGADLEHRKRPLGALQTSVPPGWIVAQAARAAQLTVHITQRGPQILIGRIDRVGQIGEQISVPQFHMDTQITRCHPIERNGDAISRTRDAV